MKIDKGLSEELRFKIEQVKSALLANPGKKLSNNDNLPQAAVCMILRPDLKSNESVMLLIKRRESQGDPWSGHMAFPGGRYVEADQNALSTAIRETVEETKIDLRKCSMLGTLDELIPGNQSIRVTPFVALAPERVDVKINEREISNYFWIPLSFFRDSRNASTHTEVRMGNKFTFPSYLFLGQFMIWGMTLRMIQDFLSKTSPSYPNSYSA